MAIFPVALLMHAYVSKMKPLVGVNHKHFIMHYTSGFLTALKDEDDWLNTGKEVYAYIKKHPGCIKKVARIFLDKTANLLLHSRRMSIFNDDIASDAAVELFDKYCELYIEASVYGECLPYTIKELLASELHNELSKYENGPEVFSLITIPQHLSFTMREEIDFLKRLKIYKTQRNDDIISEHHFDYSWLTYDYDNGEWSKNDIKSKFDEHVKLSEDNINLRLNDLSLFVEKTRVAEEECIKKYGVDSNVVLLSKILKDSVLLMDIKKEQLTKIHHYTYNFFLKAANYLGVERNFFSYVIPFKFSNIIKSRDSKSLIERYNSSSIYISADGWKLIKTPQAIQKLTGENNIKKRTVKGLCAYPGKIEGSARIVRTIEDIKSFKSGEVLIATMTTVDFIEAMKKASAIVTDDGGVICHAAIISREMKKPCIVGSKIATNTFKNGDIVAIDADNGVIDFKWRQS